MDTETYSNYSEDASAIVNRDLSKPLVLKLPLSSTQTNNQNQNAPIEDRDVEVSVEPVISPHLNQDNACRSIEPIEPSLNLSDYLPEEIATPLQQVADAMPTSPEMLLNTLLPVSASLIGAAATLAIKSNWKEPCIIWSINVADSGTLKSPTQKVIVDPLWKVQTELENEYHQQLENYKESDSKVEPMPTDVIVSNCTTEAIAHIHRRNPKGFLLYSDEINAFFKGMNQYKGGKGNDLQTWLSFYDGGSVKIDRVDSRKRISLEKTSISIVGSIQPKVFSGFLSANDNGNGWIARFTHCSPKMPLPLDKGNECPDVSKLLLTLYKKLKVLRSSNFTFSTEAQSHWRNEWNNPIVGRTAKESDSRLKESLSKARGRCARIALVFPLYKRDIRIG